MEYYSVCLFFPRKMWIILRFPYLIMRFSLFSTRNWNYLIGKSIRFSSMVVVMSWSWVLLFPNSIDYPEVWGPATRLSQLVAFPIGHRKTWGGYNRADLNQSEGITLCIYSVGVLWRHNNIYSSTKYSMNI